jgi:hypothetical protein
MRRGLKMVAAVLAVGFLFSSIAAAQDYQIKLSRPEKVGNEFHISTVSSQSTLITVKAEGGAPEQMNEAGTVALEAGVKVLEIDKNGSPSKITLTVETCTLKKGEAAAAEVLAKGTVVTAFSKDGVPVFEIGGKPVTPDVAKALAIVVHLGDGGVTDDEIFGTKDRKKVGDQWPINSDVAAKDLVKRDMPITKENLTGTVKLESAAKVGATDCLDIRAQMSGKNIAVPMPPGLKVEEGSLEASFAQKIPVDPAARPLEQSLDITMKVAAKGKPEAAGATEMTIETTVKMSQKAKYSAAK